MQSPFIIVIFGATGDLAQHKLFPALFSLYKQGSLSNDLYVVGFARRELTDKAYQEFLAQEMDVSSDPQWESFASRIFYQQGLFDEPRGYTELIEKLHTFDKQLGACLPRVFYLATPPDNYPAILQNLTETKLSEGCGSGSEQWTRVAIEKPFGKDLETAENLDKTLSEMFEEKQIFRVDHYLGKETVQNMIAFRFANSIFEPVWNKEHVDHVQITWAESSGIGKRGQFFDGVGMLRDVAQNHLLQLLATVAMEQPKSFSKEAVRDARADAIRAIRPINSEEVSQLVIRGQYEGYTKEKDVAQDSQTETYVAMKLFVDTPRFADVPFYLRAGKKMDKDLVDIKIVFKQTCHVLFKEAGCPEIGNVLTIRIQPDEGISLRVIAKEPSTAKASSTPPSAKFSLATVNMNFSYHHTFGSHGVDAYEKILLDCINGDQMLFNRSDELESSWQLISSILKGESAPRVYPQGSWGPDAAVDLLAKDGRSWLLLDTD